MKQTMLRAYASRCSGKTAELLRSCGWGMLLTPLSRPPRPFEDMPWCLDNGAWHAYTTGKPWEPSPFMDLVSEYGVGADWVVAPDLIGQGRVSLALSESYLPDLVSTGLVLVPVQDGISEKDVRPLLSDGVGLFVGGTTPWKLHSLPIWGRLSEETGCYLHVARVNTVSRIKTCHAVLADSFDGSGVSQFRQVLPRLEAARRAAVGRVARLQRRRI